jgi:hypothetical protein
MFSRILGFVFSVGGLFPGMIHTKPVQPVNPAPISRSAPELDPSSLGAGILMLIGGLSALREQRRKKK